MIKQTLKNLMSFLKSEAIETMYTPNNQDMVFHLTFKNLEIGKLQLREGSWTFAYSDAFKHQNRIQPLVDFPKPEKIYQNESLWPFFASRIPSLNQPHVQETVRKKQIDTANMADMLKEFGSRTITNPFALQAVR